MGKFVRTKTRAEGGLTAAEKVEMGKVSDFWIKNAFRTDSVNPEKLIPAIKKLYAVAKLKEPKVIIVPSPKVMAFAGVLSACVLQFRKTGIINVDATSDATDSATRAATSAAIDDATSEATYAATYAAIESATREATRDATYAATRDATREATNAATRAATRAAIDDATDDATRTATRAATDDATRAATYDATESATYVATSDATDSATRAATRAATSAAIDDATDDATRTATESATSAAINDEIDDATYATTESASLAATDDVTYDATIDEIYAAIDNATSDVLPLSFIELVELYVGKKNAKFVIHALPNWWRMYQGGNMWSSWCAYLSGARDVLGLDLPEHKAYASYEKCAIEGGFRLMHEEFCMVSDRPEILKIDNENRPHCEDGPSHKWRDGWSLYYWHGVKIPAEWIENKNNLTAKTALTWSNIEQRRAACEIVGWAKILKELDAVVIDKDDDPSIGTLLEVDLPDSGKERFIYVKCGTGREFALPVPRECNTALSANAWTYGLDGDTYRPEVRT